MGRSSTGMLACLLLASAAKLAHADTVHLQVDKTATPGQVRVHWTGGTPMFAVFESPVPTGVTNPANELGTTPTAEWLDAPAGTISYYVVTTPCLAEPPAACCVGDGDCFSTEFCQTATGLCAPKSGNGVSCGGGNQCTSGNCIDDVCCNNTCGGTCRGCDTSGLEGACASFLTGTDPDAECGAVSCAGFYWGFSGDACFRRADVSAAQATCDGAGACKTAAQECPQSSQGSIATTCNANCQDPTPGTCTGTTAGACTNVNPGTQTCGTGACRVTVAQCVNGAPNNCIPLSPTTETCNGIDDNCDGTIDNNSAFADGLESNDTCGTYRTLASASDAGSQINLGTATLYGSGDVDIYRVNGVEQGTTCACCDGFFCLDEDFRLTVSLTVPPGAGSYEVCVAKDVCPATWTNCTTVSAGLSGSVQSTYDGACPGVDDSTHFVRIRGVASPGFKCNPYTLSYQLVQGCFP